MFDLLLSGPLLWAGVGLLIVGAVWWVYRKGSAAERARQDAARHKARDIAGKVEDDVARRSSEENRERLREWGPGDRP